MKTWKFAALGGVLGLSVVANATFYTSEAAFTAAIDPTYYLEDFNNFNVGDPLNGDLTWSAPGANGYGWDASAALGLYSNNYSSGALSTNYNDDPLTLTFTGLPVTAFGGLLGNTDIEGKDQGGTCTLTMSNGDTITVNDGTFVGWVGTSAASSVTMTAQGVFDAQNFPYDWIQLDHAYTGTNLALVPEPASFAVLGLGAIAMIRRRNKKA